MKYTDDKNLSLAGKEPLSGDITGSAEAVAQTSSRGLRKRMAKAFADGKQVDQSRGEMEFLRTRDTLLKTLQTKLDVSEWEVEVQRADDRPVALIEGLRFSYFLDTQEFEEVPSLLHTCPRCGKDVPQGVYSLEGLAKAVEKPYLGYSHDVGLCARTASADETTEQKLITLLKEFIAENAQPIE